MFSRTNSIPRLLKRLPPVTRPPYPSSTRSASSSTPPPKLNTAHLTPSEAHSKKVEQASTTKKVPPLSRALGVREPPKNAKGKKGEWREMYVDRDKRLKERKHLVEQVAQGYFSDFNAMRHEGGKTWMAPTTLIRSDLSLYFPDMQGISLATKENVHTTDLFEGKVSVVAISSVRSSEEHINSFIRPVMSDLENDPDFQYIYINLQENPLKSLIVSLFISSLRRTIPPSQQPTYLLSHQNLEYLREPLGMKNKLVGYVYLVDEEGKIRWGGCSWAEREEEEGLRKCAWVLMERLRKLKGGPAKDVPKEIETGEKV